MLIEFPNTCHATGIAGQVSRSTAACERNALYTLNSAAEYYLDVDTLF